jgi:repressor LexA
MIIVEKCSNAKPGEIVVARIDEGYTLKYLRKNKDGYYLEPANSKYSNIYPEVSLEIQAKLKAVIRKYE